MVWSHIYVNIVFFVTPLLINELKIYYLLPDNILWLDFDHSCLTTWLENYFPYWIPWNTRYDIANEIIANYGI